MATSTVIKNKKSSKVIEDCKNRISEVIYNVPFKIRITNITVPGYSPSNVPPIGIAIIGFNNYIL